MSRLSYAVLSLLALLLALGLAGCGYGDGDESVALTAGDPVLLQEPADIAYWFPLNINDAGQILGFRNDAASRFNEPVVWSPQGDYQTLPGLNGMNCIPNALNHLGEIVGYSCESGGNHAMVWSPGTGARTLTLPAEYAGANSEATAINDNGLICGYVYADRGSELAVLWSPTGEMRNLGVLPGCASAMAIDINRAGTVVGWSIDAVSFSSFRWTSDGGLQELRGLPGATDSLVAAISDTGWAAGYCHIGDQSRPVVWTPSGQARPLSLPPNAEFASASDINNAGIAVGNACVRTDQGQVYRAAAWAPDGQVLLLPTPPGCADADAHAINTNNEVVGTVTINNDDHACRWSLSLR